MVTMAQRNDVDKPGIFQVPGRNDINAQDQINRIERVMAHMGSLAASCEGKSALQYGSTYDNDSYLLGLQLLVE